MGNADADADAHLPLQTTVTVRIMEFYPLGKLYSQFITHIAGPSVKKRRLNRSRSSPSHPLTDNCDVSIFQTTLLVRNE
jgi:hypothetical protein